MSLTLQEMLVAALRRERGVGKSTAITVAAHFSDLQDFLDWDVTNPDERPRRANDHRVGLTSDAIKSFEALQRSGCLVAGRDNRDNLTAVLARAFAQRQIDAIRETTLTDLLPNPFLIAGLGLGTVDQICHFNVYAYVTRSIVTSMGTFAERLLRAASTDVTKLAKGAWDLVWAGANGKQHWLQIKSGPNVMNADQVKACASAIQATAAGDSALIGMTYGRRDQPTVTRSLLKKALGIGGWDKHTLYGAELWARSVATRSMDHRFLN
jgi:hypothetical protein